MGNNHSREEAEAPLELEAETIRAFLSDLAPEGITALTAKLTSGNFDRIIFDNAASVNVFAKKELIQYLKPLKNKITLGGAAGSNTVLLTHVGKYREITVLWGEHVSANLLSQAVCDQFHGHSTYDDTNRQYRLKVRMTDETLVFNRAPDGMHVLTHIERDNEVSHAYHTTVERAKQNFTPKEIAEAEKAAELRARLGFPSLNTVVQLVKRGAIKTDSVSQHFINSEIINGGPPEPYLKGKSVHKTIVQPKEREQTIQTRVAQKLHADLFFINEYVFLIVVSDPMDFIHVGWLQDKEAETLEDGLTFVINAYTNRGHTAESIQFDSEAGVKAIKQRLETNCKITVEIKPSSDKVAVAERKIRTLKESVRCVLHDIPFHVWGDLIVYVILFCANKLSLWPTKKTEHQEVPWLQYHGYKPDENQVARHKLFQFGHLVVNETDNTVQSTRTIRALYLGEPSTPAGGHLYLNLEDYLATPLKLTTVRSNRQFTTLNWPREVIDKLDKIAEGKNPYEQPHWRWVYRGDEIKEENVEPEEKIENDEEQTAPPGPAIMQRQRDDNLAPPQLEAVESRPNARTITDNPGNKDRGARNMAKANKRLHENDRGANEPSKKGNHSQETDDTSTTKRKDDNKKRQSEEQSSPKAKDQRKMEKPIQSSEHERSAVWNLRPRQVADYKHMAPEEAAVVRAKKARFYNMLATEQQRMTQKMLDAMEPELKDSTLEAVRKEYEGLRKKKAFTPIWWKSLTDSQKRKTLPSSCVVKHKHNSDGIFLKVKARLVVGGHRQDRSIYEENDTASPTVNMTSIMLQAAIAARERRHVMTIDFVGAYLFADMPTDPQGDPIHMKLDKINTSILVKTNPEYEEFVNEDGTIVVRLDRALYGCIQSARLWYEKLMDELKAIGFVPNPEDPCVLNAYFDGTQVTTSVHVDDLFITCEDLEVLQLIEKHLRGRFDGELNAQYGPTVEYLGVYYDFSIEGVVKLSMTGAINEITEGVEKESSSPATEYLFHAREESPPLTEFRAKQFHSTVMSAMYIAKRVRPDILCPISFLSTRVQNPTEDDWSKLQRVLQYVKATKDLTASLEPNFDLELFAYVDASYAVHDDAKSHGGIFMTLGKGPIYVQSRKHKIVTKSSTESELVTATDATATIAWVRDWLIGQGYDMGPAIMFQDNKSAMILSERGKGTSQRTRHINVRYFFIKDRIENKELKLRYCETLKMLADILTKPLQGSLFKELRDAILNHSHNV